MLPDGDKERCHEVLEYYGGVTGKSIVHGLVEASRDCRTSELVDKVRLERLIETEMRMLQYGISAGISNETVVLAQLGRHKIAAQPRTELSRWRQKPQEARHKNYRTHLHPSISLRHLKCLRSSNVVTLLPSKLSCLLSLDNAPGNDFSLYHVD